METSVSRLGAPVIRSFQRHNIIMYTERKRGKITSPFGMFLLLLHFVNK